MNSIVNGLVFKVKSSQIIECKLFPPLKWMAIGPQLLLSLHLSSVQHCPW